MWPNWSVGATRHRRTAQKITDRTITLVRNHRRLLPLAPSRGACRYTGWGADNTRTLTDAIGQRYGQTTSRSACRR